jgi:hypothetical protein
MYKKVCVILIVFLIVPLEAAFNSTEQVSAWMTGYYRNPEPSRIPGAVVYMSRGGLLDNRNAVAPVFGFLSGVFWQNPERVSGWVKQMESLPDRHLGVVVLGLWYAEQPDSRERTYALLERHPKLAEEFAFLYRGSPMKVEDIPLEQGAWVLDALWGRFMATGSPKAVRRIISVLPWVELKGDTGRLLIGGAAQWSLISNAAQHPLVMRICEEEAARQSEKVASGLHRVIEEARKERKRREKPVQDTSH